MKNDIFRLHARKEALCKRKCNGGAILISILSYVTTHKVRMKVGNGIFPSFLPGKFDCSRDVFRMWVIASGEQALRCKQNEENVENRKLEIIAGWLV